MQLDTDYNYDSLTVSILNKNTNSNINQSQSMKSKLSNDSYVRISHYYVDENLNIPSIDLFRSKDIEYDKDYKLPFSSSYLNDEQRKRQYTGEEDKIKCGRFPKQVECMCSLPCSLILPKIEPIEIIKDKLYAGPIEVAYKTKYLLSMNVSHILNLSCMEYHKRKFFKYFDIFINDTHTENAIKFFKITNRFISKAIDDDKKVLVHSINGKGRCWVFIIAYLIGRERKKFHEAIEYVKELFPRIELNENFYTQLKHYDLEMNN